MRHSDPRLTMNRYTRAKLHDLGAAVQKLPRLNPVSPESEPVVRRATGTDGGCSSDAVTGGSGRGQVKADEEMCTGTGDPDSEGAGMKKPLCLQGFEDDQG